MIGAIVGDIAGSRFEFHNRKTKEFSLMVSASEVRVPARQTPKTGGRSLSLAEVLLKSGAVLTSSSIVPSERPCYFTDNTVMTLAVAQAILDWRSSGSSDMADLSAAAVSRMQEFGRRYPHASYGGAFRRWLKELRPQPYNSWGIC